MTSRLAALRAALAPHAVDGFIIPRADEHLGEYVPPSAERLAWLTGFTGSAGLAIVLRDQAAAFTDGRYTLQLAAETDGAVFERLHIVDQPPQTWAAARARRLGYDPWLMAEEAVARYAQAGLDMVPIAPNPIDGIWTDRPAPPSAAATPHPLAAAGQSAHDKRRALATLLQEAGQDACVLTDTASVAWLFNIRGADLAYTPVPLAFAILRADATAQLFIHPDKLPQGMQQWLGPDVECRPQHGFPAALAALSGQTVRTDPAANPAAIAQALRDAGAIVVAGTDPCTLPKARKNPVEQDGARAAHRRDAVAVCRFLHWLDHAAGQTELSAAARLLAFRQAVPGFTGESFPAISGAGPHGAIIHYRVTPATDRAIGRNEVYLIDSGGQFEDGTTDVTRTVWTGPDAPPAELRDRFTRVLKGNIALATAQFPRGVAGPHLDALARRALWDAGLDYDHGTGHGVGSALSVHEGPVSISRAARIVAIEPGMILSDEPGFYQQGAYGIRLENLLLVQPAETDGPREFLRFEVLTLAPFDRRLIEPALLTRPERAWLDAYHARVRHEVQDPALAPWLAQACAPL